MTGVRAERDTARNLRLVSFVGRYAEQEEDRVQLEQWKPDIALMNGIARAKFLLEQGQSTQAIEIAHQTLEKLESVDAQTKSGRELLNALLQRLPASLAILPALRPRAESVFSQHGGMISQGFTLTMTRPGGSGDIYYTVDGSDPRLPGGGLSTSAIRYTGPVSLSQTTTVRARVRSGTTWSALTKATFTFDMAAIRVTEVIYHPALPPAGSPFAEGDFEYVEIMNTAGTSRLPGNRR